MRYIHNNQYHNKTLNLKKKKAQKFLSTQETFREEFQNFHDQNLKANPSLSLTKKKKRKRDRQRERERKGKLSTN
mgnify:CR=1 FL=1